MCFSLTDHADRAVTRFHAVFIIIVSVGYDKKALIDEQGQRSSNIIKYRNKMTTE